jgi:predicted secreted protein
VRMLTDMLHGMPFLCHRILEFVGDFLKREKKNIKIRISGRGTRDRG